MRDSKRPRIHLTPPAGWMNDPHGLAIHDGRLHVFYQYEPDAPRWGRMRWGHASTRDLINWDHLPIAIEPGPGGPDALGCWSGCLVQDGAGVPTIFYTGVRLAAGVRRASIRTATGTPDLATWSKQSTPVIASSPRGIPQDMFRDPFVWPTDQGWAMLVGAGTQLGRGVVLLYRSRDLRRWTLIGPFLTTEDLVTACPDLDVAEIDSVCWECPQLLRFENRACLIVSVVDRSPIVRPAHVVAVTGRIAGDRFVPSRAERLGLGPDFYAPASLALADGRALLIGWIPEDPPAAGEERAWAGAMTLPRAVTLDPDGRPRISLVEELANMGQRSAVWEQVIVRDDQPWVVNLTDPHVELRLAMRPAGVPIRIDLTAGGRLVAEIRFDPRSCRLAATRIGRVLVAGLSPVGSATLPSACAEELDLRIILDGSILELIAADRVTATVRIPEAEAAWMISCATFAGSCRIVHAELRSLGDADPRGRQLVSDWRAQEASRAWPRPGRA